MDQVWIMVSKKNPLKLQETTASEDQRLEMANFVAENCKNVEVTDIETYLSSPSFTIDSLEALKRKFPQHSFKVIIGSDSLENFSNWKDSERIQKEFGLIVYPRPGFPLPPIEPDNTTFLNGAPQFSISSSLIREYVASGWNINYFVPLSVSNYIREKKLYQ